MEITRRENFLAFSSRQATYSQQKKKTENSTYFERNDCKKELSSQGCEALKGRARDSLVLIHIQ